MPPVTAFAPDIAHWKWSQEEKVIARRAFDMALRQELDDVIRETKARSAQIAQPSDLWDLESYLTQRRTQIDREFDYRYSVLPVVFARLIRTGRLTEHDLDGLAEDKLKFIRQMK